MEVKCINNKGLENYLTLNSVYLVYSQLETGYSILDDTSSYACYTKDRFEIVENSEQQKENIIKPSYYNKENGISPFEYIRANNLNFFEGNIIKYVTRYKEKNGLEDLKKANTYLKELINNYEVNND